MKLEDLKQIPHWVLFLLAGTLMVLLGSAADVTVGSNSLRIPSPFNIVVIVAGALLIMVAVWHSMKRDRTDELPVTKVEIRSVDIDRTDTSLRIRVSGRIEPAAQGVRVWIAREHQAQSPGRFHLADKPALTDKNGDWEQFTYLWPRGTFRIHAVVAGRAAESLFVYYRTAFNHARSVYQQTVDKAAVSFPGWPTLEELPPGCVSDFYGVTV